MDAQPIKANSVPANQRAIENRTLMSIRGRESKIASGSFDSPNFEGFTLSKVFKMMLTR